MITNKRQQRLMSSRATTLMELLIVVSIIGILSIAIYQALSNGIKIWHRVHQLRTEEDVAIFLDKLNHDLRNAYVYSKFKFLGDEYHFRFPTIVYTLADRRSDSKGEHIDQLGEVEYYYDFSDKNLYRRQANYGQAIAQIWAKPQLLAKNLEEIKFRYYYLTGNGDYFSQETLEVFPSGIEVEIRFLGQQGHQVIREYFNILLGS